VQSIEAETEMSSAGDHMVNMLTTLMSVFEQGIRAAFPNIMVAVVVTPAAQEKFGDYQCNSAMNIAQVVRAAELCSYCSIQNIALKFVCHHVRQ